MTNNIMRSLRFPITLAALFTFSACGGETAIAPTFGSGCSEGRISAGQSVEGEFTDESCTVPYHFWSGNSVPYASYSVSLQAGKGYWFYLRQIPNSEELNGVDALLTLYGKNESGASVPLAVSDDNAGGVDGHDSEIFFIAPRSGAFNIVAASYDVSELGGYRLTMEECPVVAVLDTAGTYDGLPFAQSNCVRHELDATGDPSRIVLVGVPADAGETVEVSVTANDFDPVIEMGGPGFDVYDNIYQEMGFASASGPPAIISFGLGDVAGTLTLAVGATEFDPAGNFTVALTRTAPLAAPVRTSSALMMKSSFGAGKLSR